ncbi:hypothetical protein AVEN_197187-1 [Araneus ventricosus]|uniref:F-box domain-containing protein n=1 Tax=Araneus ventricosus TaxID=182803 RepID=A0A4Y2RHC6_ARAVE|nr:hypothetical protein AVEN_215257-1 [Araneus ventricosus]GBO38915.1 hypothetical protein AVEN_197187-1 [Araneus ventricosus]
MGALLSSEQKTEIEESEKKDWSELPLPPLEKIYSYLSHADRAKMSLVCRNWSQGYGSPSLWTNFRFKSCECQLSMDTCSLIKFVMKYGSMFRHVEVRYYHSTRSNYAWCRHLIAFLQQMTTNSQLTSVKFRGFMWCFPHIDASFRGDVKRTIGDFLGSQDHLKTIQFTYCFCNYGECLELLKELNVNSRNSIEHLRLQVLGFCEPLQAKEQDSDVTQGLLTLTGLESLTTALEIEYSLIFENKFARQSAAIKTLNCTQRLILSKLIIEYDSFFRDTDIDVYDGLKSFDWEFLTKLYPDLQVELNISSYSLLMREVERLIVRNMPITRLNYIIEDSPNHSSLMQIEEFFFHLLVCKTNDHLITLYLNWEIPIPNLASTFIPFLQACKKLEFLDLFIASPVNGLGSLLESWLENRPESLEKVQILIFGIDDEDDRKTLQNSTTEYVSRLKSIGLNVKVDFYF